jgi:hypothetical protein
MNMSNTRWLYVARRQWGEVSTVVVLRRTTPQEEKKIDENVEAWGKAKEKWGGEESLKKTRKKKQEKRAVKQPMN